VLDGGDNTRCTLVSTAAFPHKDENRCQSKGDVKGDGGGRFDILQEDLVGRDYCFVASDFGLNGPGRDKEPNEFARELVVAELVQSQ
jgi:hypothetical protein